MCLIIIQNLVCLFICFNLRLSDCPGPAFAPHEQPAAHSVWLVAACHSHSAGWVTGWWHCHCLSGWLFLSSSSSFSRCACQHRAPLSMLSPWHCWALLPGAQRSKSAPNRHVGKRPIAPFFPVYWDVDFPVVFALIARHETEGKGKGQTAACEGSPGAARATLVHFCSSRTFCSSMPIWDRKRHLSKNLEW